MADRAIDAIIFDFDGVIVRSIELHAVAYQLALRPLGIHVTVEDVLVLEGARSESIIERLVEAAGRPITDGLLERLSTIKQRIFETVGAPQLYPGATEAVERARELGFPMAVASGTRRENVPKLAPHLVELFDHVITQERYTHDKPHPEPYLTAAAALGTDPASCLVIENAPFGIESARSAGMQVVAVTSTLSAEHLSAADRIVPSVADVVEVLPEAPGQAARLEA